MGRWVIATETVPAQPAAGKLAVWPDVNGKILCWKDDAGLITGRGDVASIAAQGAGFAADTYVTDSGLVIPSFGPQVRSRIRWIISASKTAAGIATPVYTIRIGPNRSTADTSRLVLTGPAQTAAADAGVLSIYLVFRASGAVAVIQGDMNFDHNLAATGFANNATAAVSATSASFDATALAGQFIGLSINGGASAAWTISQVRGEAVW